MWGWFFLRSSQVDRHDPGRAIYYSWPWMCYNHPLHIAPPVLHKHQNCFLPCCHAISSEPTSCGSCLQWRRKNLALAVLSLCFYMYSCTWPAQYGLVPRSSSEARFTFDSCPNKHSLSVSLHVVYFYSSRGTFT